MHSSDFTIDMSNGEIVWTAAKGEPWRVTVLDTGPKTMTGGRMKRARDIIGNETFCLTYGDGVSDVDIGKLVAFHREGGKWATVTAVEPPGRFGVLNFTEESHEVASFREKDGRDVGFVNGGAERQGRNGTNAGHCHEALQGWIGPDEAAARMLTGRGYREVRRFYEMAIELDDAPIAPVYFNTHNWLMAPRVRGWREDALWTRRPAASIA